MAQQASLAVKAGIVIVTGIIILVGLSLKSGSGWFEQGYRIEARFDSAKALEPGSKVVIAGVPIGQVRDIVLTPEGQVRAIMLIEPGRQIPDDSVGSIRLKTMLGSYRLYIEPGESDTMLAEGGELSTEDFKELTDVIQDFGGISTEAGDLFASIDQSQQELFDRLNAVIDENRQNISEATGALAEVGPKINELVDSLNRLVGRVEAGEGTLGKLATDDRAYTELLDLIERLQNFGTQLTEGEGMVADLLQDPEMAAELRETMSNLRDSTERVRGVIERNEENIDRILASTAEGLPRLDEGIGHFTEIGRKINEGEGTLGRMVNDPSLYENVNAAVRQIRRAFEEGEEQTVMRTFLGVLFGSLI